jgi:GxxExxY protein
MTDLLYRDETHLLIGRCMEIHRELGNGHEEVIYKDAFVVELSRASIPFEREKKYEITYKGVLLAHPYYADFVVFDKIIFEAKAVEKLTDSQRQTGPELPCRFQTPARPVGELRRRLCGMEARRSMMNESVPIREIRVSSPRLKSGSQ